MRPIFQPVHMRDHASAAIQAAAAPPRSSTTEPIGWMSATAGKKHMNGLEVSPVRSAIAAPKSDRPINQPKPTKPRIRLGKQVSECRRGSVRGGSPRSRSGRWREFPLRWNFPAEASAFSVRSAICRAGLSATIWPGGTSRVTTALASTTHPACRVTQLCSSSRIPTASIGTRAPPSQ